jgi:hypothetical protein
MDYDKIKNLKINELLRFELVKFKTYTLIVVEKTKDKYIFHHNITSMEGAYDSDGDFDEDGYDIAIERDPIIEETIRTVSAHRIIKEINRLARYIEPEIPLISGTSDLSFHKCLMNLSYSDLYHPAIRARYRSTADTMEDRKKYELAKKLPYHNELLEKAWHPERYREWCLDEEERRRIESYRHDK